MVFLYSLTMIHTMIAPKKCITTLPTVQLLTISSKIMWKQSPLHQHLKKMLVVREKMLIENAKNQQNQWRGWNMHIYPTFLQNGHTNISEQNVNVITQRLRAREGWWHWWSKVMTLEYTGAVPHLNFTQIPSYQMSRATNFDFLIGKDAL